MTGGASGSPLAYYQTVRISLSHSQDFVLAMVGFPLALRITDGGQRGRVWLALRFFSALLVATCNIAAAYLTFPADFADDVDPVVVAETGMR